MKLSSRRGVLLVAYLMLMVFASIAVLGVSTFLVEHLRRAGSRVASEGCLHLARAGVQGSIYVYRRRAARLGAGNFALGRFDVDGQRYYVIGGDDADFAMWDTSAARVVRHGRRYRLVGLALKNAVRSRKLRIKMFVVTWNGRGRLRKVVIDGRRRWRGKKKSPARIRLRPQVVLDRRGFLRPLDYLEFDEDVHASTIRIRFIMKDGSGREVTVYPASRAFDFIVNATGRISGEALYRTLRVEYNTLTGTIIAEREIDAQIPE